MSQPLPLPERLIEAAFTLGANTGTALHLDDSTRGLLDTGTLAGEEVWEDISAYGRQIQTRQGATRIDSPVIQFEPGTATAVLVNDDRRFDPTNTSGPYVAAGKSQVTSMRAIRIRAVWAGVTYDLFRGFADEWAIDWEGPAWSEATVTATDAFKVLDNRRRPTVAPTGTGENAGARVQRVLNSAGWPASDRVIATGNTTLQATTLDGSPLAELQAVAETEIGELYVDGAGRVVFRNRLALFTDPRSNTSQATFGDVDGELRYAERGLSISADDATLYTEARITRDGGIEQVAAADAASQDEFLTRTFDRSGLLMQTDVEAANYAAWILHVSREPEVRFTQMVIKPRRDPDTLFPQVLGRRIGDRITIIRRPPGGGDPIVQDVWIRYIAHDIGLDDWTTTWTLQSAERFSFLTLNHAMLGELDANALAY